MTRPGKGPGAPATVTQVRTWVYDSNKRLYSVVHPESGTTAKPSVRYNYNPDGSVQWKMDAKDQKTVYTYDSDGRVSVTQRYLTGGSEDTCAKVEYFYNSQTFDATFSQNATGRLAATATGCTTSGAGKLIEMYSYNAAGAVVKKRLRIVRGSGTVDKDVTYTYGTDGKLATVLYPGTTVPYTYSYDLMDRPNKMTGPPTLLGTTTADLVKDVNYGVAGQVTSMKYMQWQDNGAVNYFTENRTYNSLFQLTRQETIGATAAADIEYSYTAPGSTLNDGRIVSRKNNMRNGASGETVTYTYDELNRVTQAASVVGWTQSFDYDGFGNMWTASMAGGTATPFNVTYSQTTSTNRIATAGWGYDDNGNTTAMPVTGGYASLAYDVDNRLKTWTGPAGTEEYGYLADNKRVWKKSPAGVETVYFYGVGGQKLVTYTLQTSPLALVAPSENVYFGGKLIRADGQTVVRDRLGSVVARGDLSSSSVSKHDYLPYGEEMGAPTNGNVDKFGTYLRDQTTGLDYADQRFYGGTSPRFLTADPYEASGRPPDPGSWNRFSYVGGDPAGRSDALGLEPGMTYCDLYPYDRICSPYPGDPRPPSDGPAPKFMDHINLAKRLQKRVSDGEITECEGLAQFAEQAAKATNGSTGTMLAWFEAINPSTDNPRALLGEAAGLIRTSEDGVYLGGDNGRDNGFQEKYKDGAHVVRNTLTGPVWGGGNNGDQSHHFAAFIQVGFWLGDGVASSIVNTLTDPSGTGDHNLGEVAIAIGAALRANQNGQSTYDIGKTIREQLCKKK